MMKKIVNFLILFICFSCKNTGKPLTFIKHGEIVYIDSIYDKRIDYSEMNAVYFSLTKDYKKFGENFGSTQLIPLITSEEAMIGNIRKIIFYENRFYVHNEAANNSSIMIFDKTGNFESKIEKVGRGPGEYIRLSDFDMDANGDIYISDDMQADKLLVYNRELKFIQQIKLEASVRSFCIFNDKIYGYSARSDYKNKYKYLLLAIDKNGKVCDRFFPYEHVTPGIIYSNNNVFTKNNGKVFLNMPFCDIIYSIDSINQVKAEYQLLYEVKDSEGKIINRFKTDESKLFYPMGDKFMVQTSHKQVYGCYSYVVGIYKKGGNETKFMDTWDFKDDFSRGVLTYPFANLARTMIGDSILVQSLSAFNFLSAYKNKVDSLKASFPVFEELVEEDNPILFLNKIQ